MTVFYPGYARVVLALGGENWPAASNALATIGYWFATSAPLIEETGPRIVAPRGWIVGSFAICVHRCAGK
ncbi:UNVERIFIED_ORG: hypothetical protein LHK14_14530 [Roseateles sp. XES5]|nr:hypothetical protein [Roseateles sp. XES5]